MLLALEKHKRVAVRSGHKISKALALDTPIPTPDGWTTMGALEPGHVVFGADGSQVKVTAVTPVMVGRKCLDVVFDDGTVVTADAEHLWQTWTAQARKALHRNPDSKLAKPKVLTTAEIRESLITQHSGRNHAVINAAPAQYVEAELAVDPYVLGVWLGDGTSSCGAITTADPEIVEFVKAAGFPVRKVGKNSSGAMTFTPLTLVVLLRELGVLNNKHVPVQYLTAGEQQRRDLLAGLLDSDGCCAKNGSVAFSNTNLNIAKSVFELAASLGFKPHLKEHRARLYEKDCGPYWGVYFTPHEPVFRLTRKLARQHPGKSKSAWVKQRMIVAVEPTAAVDVKCISVDAEDGLFLCSRAFIPTHNSCSAAVAALWFFSTFELARVIITAPTAGQIKRILWRELTIRSRQAKIPFPHVPKDPSTGITSFDGFREIVGVSTDEAERMQGFSSPNMLYIVDEGSGVSEEIFEAIEGNRAGGAYILMLGNPTQPAGTFYDAFNDPNSAWHTIHVSSREAAAADPHIRGLATLEWCDEKLKEWGPDDPRYQVRVLGNFADSSEAAIIPLSALLKSQQDWPDTVGKGRLELGVDPARFGDDETAIAVRRGNEILELITASKLDEHSVAEKVMECVARHQIKGEGKPLVKIDTCGTIGPGVASVLRVTNEVDLVQVNGADPSDHPDKYINMRAQLWFACAEWIKAGGTMPKQRELESDLLAPRYEFDQKNRLKVEAKKDIKKRLRRSPDRGDAVVLAAYTPRIKLAVPIRGNSRASGSKYRWGSMGRGF